MDSPKDSDGNPDFDAFPYSFSVDAAENETEVSKLMKSSCQNFTDDFYILEGISTLVLQKVDGRGDLVNGTEITVMIQEYNPIKVGNTEVAWFDFQVNCDCIGADPSMAPASLPTVEQPTTDHPSANPPNRLPTTSPTLQPSQISTSGPSFAPAASDQPSTHEGPEVCIEAINGSHRECHGFMTDEGKFVGNMCLEVGLQSTGIVVRFETVGNWRIVGQHMWVGSNVVNMPRTEDGSPNVEAFPYNWSDKKGQTGVTQLLTPRCESGTNKRYSEQGVVQLELRQVDDAGDVIASAGSSAFVEQYSTLGNVSSPFGWFEFHVNCHCADKMTSAPSATGGPSVAPQPGPSSAPITTSAPISSPTASGTPTSAPQRQPSSVVEPTSSGIPTSGQPTIVGVPSSTTFPNVNPPVTAPSATRGPSVAPQPGPSSAPTRHQLPTLLPQLRELQPVHPCDIQVPLWSPHLLGVLPATAHYCGVPIHTSPNVNPPVTSPSATGGPSVAPQPGPSSAPITTSAPISSPTASGTPTSAPQRQPSSVVAPTISSRPSPLLPSSQPIPGDVNENQTSVPSPSGTSYSPTLKPSRHCEDGLCRECYDIFDHDGVNVGFMSLDTGIHPYAPIGNETNGFVERRRMSGSLHTEETSPGIRLLVEVVGNWRVVGQQMWLGLDMMDSPKDSDGNPDFDAFPYSFSVDVAENETEVSKLMKSSCQNFTDDFYILEGISTLVLQKVDGRGDLVNGTEITVMIQEYNPIKVGNTEVAWFDFQVNCDCIGADPSMAPASLPTVEQPTTDHPSANPPNRLPTTSPTLQPSQISTSGPSFAPAASDQPSTHEGPEVCIEAINGSHRECHGFMAGEGKLVGNMCLEVGLQSTGIEVRFETVGNWRIVGQHMWVGSNVVNMPRTEDGSPNFESFPYNWSDKKGQSVVSQLVTTRCTGDMDSTYSEEGMVQLELLQVDAEGVAVSDSPTTVFVQEYTSVAGALGPFGWFDFQVNCNCTDNVPSQAPSVTGGPSTTHSPTGSPTTSLTDVPTGSPTTSTSGYPSGHSTGYPTSTPTAYPTGHPTGYQTGYPTSSPTSYPTGHPTIYPTGYPTSSPTAYPTGHPTGYPTASPTDHTTLSPTGFPTASPTGKPSIVSTAEPSLPSSLPPTPHVPSICIMTRDGSHKECHEVLSEKGAVVGNMCLEVGLQSTGIEVRFETVGNWRIVGEHMWVGSNVVNMPRTKDGSPNVEAFPYHWSDKKGQSVVSQLLTTRCTRDMDSTYSEEGMVQLELLQVDAEGVAVSDSPTTVFVQEYSSAAGALGPFGWFDFQVNCNCTDNVPTQAPLVTGGPSTTHSPTGSPTTSLSGRPTGSPTTSTSGYPSGHSTGYPTSTPTAYPTGHPTGYPTGYPTSSPTSYPTGHPTGYPTGYPTSSPTAYPTGHPTGYPTASPTDHTTLSPTGFPTASPTGKPSIVSTAEPSLPSSLPPTPHVPSICIMTRDGSHKECHEVLSEKGAVVGNMCLEVGLQSTGIEVRFETVGNWRIVGEHMWVGSNVVNMPRTEDGSPNVEAFPYHWSDKKGQSVVSQLLTTRCTGDMDSTYSEEGMVQLELLQVDAEGVAVSDSPTTVFVQEYTSVAGALGPFGWFDFQVNCNCADNVPSQAPSVTGGPSTTHSPTGSPTTSLSDVPTGSPTTSTSGYPSGHSTGYPTSTPTAYPTGHPTGYPTGYPTSSQHISNGHPTSYPTGYPTSSPTAYPTGHPSGYPTASNRPHHFVPNRIPNCIANREAIHSINR
ncbi:CLECT [Seminavis robusta]|uniref:CLECT n=1 Tax=Seminavis robusta TaxID=568900 RepID=A0A9N8ECZ2_9STRA|nr:CLECT [Seminavis robusta]|eukprot:Sro941_g222600.1 CLECT (1756) ;mRNA; f:8109-13376